MRMSEKWYDNPLISRRTDGGKKYNFRFIPTSFAYVFFWEKWEMYKNGPKYNPNMTHVLVWK